MYITVHLYIQIRIWNQICRGVAGSGFGHHDRCSTIDLRALASARWTPLGVVHDWAYHVTYFKGEFFLTQYW